MGHALWAADALENGGAGAEQGSDLQLDRWVPPLNGSICGCRAGVRTAR
jgi:hypothetical protein